MEQLRFSSAAALATIAAVTLFLVQATTAASLIISAAMVAAWAIGFSTCRTLDELRNRSQPSSAIKRRE